MSEPSPPWSPPPAAPTLGADELHVWRVDLTAEAGRAQSEQLLSEDERERAARFVFAVDRERYVAARGALRRLLGAYLAVPAAGLRFAYSAHGKPSLAGPGPGARLGFNLAHSGELALVALAWGRHVGVDVELMRGELEYAPLLPSVCSAGEQRALSALPEARRRRAFFEIWTRKEAYLKARGDGLSYPPDWVEVGLGPGEGEPLRLPLEAGAGACLVYSLEAGAGYAAAVAAAAPAARLRLFREL